MSTEEPTLTLPEIQRYSRQLIIPDFGVESQLKLKAKSALIIGCGGLGCPAALYLCATGVGKLGFVDNDQIEISNIHRQIAHDLHSLGRNKARNLADRCKSLNDLPEYVVHEALFEKKVAFELINQYDIVLDCTDNVITRYLINDVCVLLNKPCVSGSALKFEGQLTIYNFMNGPCYRCLYPKAPPPETVSNCSDAGIMGPVVGIIGSMQALECIKVLAEIGTKLNNRMLIFDGLDFQTRVIKLRPRQTETCLICSKAPKGGNQALNNSEVNETIDSFDYNVFCGVAASYNDKTPDVKLLDNQTERITCRSYKDMISLKEESKSHLLIDCRPRVQFKICALDDSINIPYDDLQNENAETLNDIRRKLGDKKSIYVVCRRGNDSQLAVDILKKHFKDLDEIKDIIGGLTSWSSEIDPNFPKY